MKTGPSQPQRLRPEAWLDAHGDVLYRYALAKTGRRDIAQDLVQETLLAGWQGQGSFQGDSSERTWLMGICRHKTLDYFRRAGRRDHGRVAWQPDASEEAEFFKRNGTWQDPPGPWSHDPLGAAEAEGFLAVLRRCIADLPNAQRDCFELRELGDVDADDASHALDISINHLYVLLHRARLRLRRCLETHWFGDKNTP